MYTIAETWCGNGTADGCFTKLTGYWGSYTPTESDGTNSGGVKFDASQCSTIYKNNVTQVFNDTMVMSLFIKAKLLLP